jgi:hypothetical protein
LILCSRAASSCLTVKPTDRVADIEKQFRLFPEARRTIDPGHEPSIQVHLHSLFLSPAPVRDRMPATETAFSSPIFTTLVVSTVAAANNGCISSWTIVYTAMTDGQERRPRHSCDRPVLVIKQRPDGRIPARCGGHRFSEAARMHSTLPTTPSAEFLLVHDWQSLSKFTS